MKSKQNKQTKKIYIYIIFLLSNKPNNGHRSQPPNLWNLEAVTQAQEAGSGSKQLLHGHQMPTMPKYYDNFFSCLICDHLRIVRFKQNKFNFQQ